MFSIFSKKAPKPQPASTFKSTHSIAQRAAKRGSLREKYPDDKFCVLVVEGLLDLPLATGTGSSNSTSSNPVSSGFQKSPKPFLLMGMERSMNVLHLIGYIKKILKINEVNSLFVEVGGVVISMTTTMGELSDRYKDTDQFVYVRVRTEDSF